MIWPAQNTSYKPPLYLFWYNKVILIVEAENNDNNINLLCFTFYYSFHSLTKSNVSCECKVKSTLIYRRTLYYWYMKDLILLGHEGPSITGTLIIYVFLPLYNLYIVELLKYLTTNKSGQCFRRCIIKTVLYIKQDTNAHN